jgi:hypothetical protein
MPALRDDSSGASAQNQRVDSNASNVDKQQSQLKNEPAMKPGEVDAGKAAPVEEVGATEAAFHKAIGLDKVPLKGMVEYTVKRAEMEAQRAEGVSRAQNVCFTNERGENLVGIQYSNEGGTFFKTRSGEKFSINIETAGNFVLSSLSRSDVNFAAVKLTVLPDQFAANVDNRILNELSTVAANMPRHVIGLGEGVSAAALDQGPAKGKEAADNAALSLKSQDTAAREGNATARGERLADKASEFRQTLEAAITDQAGAKSAVVGPSSLEAISGLIAGLATPVEAIINMPEVRTTETESTPPAPPPAFDLADIVEPTIRVVRSAKVEQPETQEANTQPANSSGMTASTAAVDDPDEVEPKVEAESGLSADEEAIRERINKAKQDRRRRYVVKDKDTLSSIAAKQLKDRRLGELIFEINKHLIPVKVVRGRPVKQLKSRMVIYLPTQVEVDEYRARLGSGLGEATEVADEIETEISENELAQELVSGLQPENASPAAHSPKSDKRDVVPEIDRQEYIVRLGDTLKTIAMKHPSLSEIGLWSLLAEVNGLSTEVDGRGQPVAKLMRGNRLMIPTAAEIERFNEENPGSQNPKKK